MDTSDGASRSLFVLQIRVNDLHWVFHGYLSKLNGSIVAAPVDSNVTLNASLNTGIDEKLLPFSYQAVVAEVAANPTG